MFSDFDIQASLQYLLPGRWSRIDILQKLWSGYGSLERWASADGDSVIVKRVSPPSADDARHPRGWQGNTGHLRKLESYQVETHWYRTYVNPCWQQLGMPRCLSSEERDGSRLLVLSDLDQAGFGYRAHDLSSIQLAACIGWLARFHAHFLGHDGDGLWPVGTYWHLATRQQEWQTMAESPLKRAAKALDDKLTAARYQTLVHGDAKPANFCFNRSGNDVAAVDFQYVGRGAGIRDLAYLLGACLDSEALASQSDNWLDLYFRTLAESMSSDLHIDLDALELEWRGLYPIAVADFARFLAGWAPDHWKLNDYAMATAQQAIKDLHN